MGNSDFSLDVITRWVGRKGTLAISQPTTAITMADGNAVEEGTSSPLQAGMRLGELCEDEAPGSWYSREFVGGFGNVATWLSTQPRPDASNAVIAVGRYYSGVEQV